MRSFCVPTLLVLLISALLSWTGCGGQSTNQGGTTPAATSSNDAAKATDKPFVIGMSQCNLGEPWRVQMNADVKAAADKHANLQVVFKDAQNDSLKQRAHVEEFVQAKVDLIIISPLEAQPLTNPIAKAYRAGIPVIVLDRAVLGDQYTCFIGADNVRIGHAAGEWIKKKLGGKGNVVELKGDRKSVV